MEKTENIRHALAEAGRAHTIAQRVLGRIHSETPAELSADLAALLGFISGVRGYLEREHEELPVIALSKSVMEKMKFDAYEVKACVHFKGESSHVDSYSNDAEAEKAFVESDDAAVLFWSLYGLDSKGEVPAICIGDYLTRADAEAIKTAIIGHAKSPTVPPGRLTDYSQRMIYVRPMERYKRKAIGKDDERGEIFEEENPDLDDQEREDKQSMLKDVASLAVEIFDRRAGEFRDKSVSADQLAAYVRDALGEGLDW